MSKARKKKSLPVTAKPVEMLPGPRIPGRTKYRTWALIIWAAGVILIFLKWWQN